MARNERPDGAFARPCDRRRRRKPRRADRCRPRPIVPGIGEELAGLGPAAPRIEHRRRRLVGEQSGRGLQVVEQPFVHWPQQEGGAPHPVGRVERSRTTPWRAQIWAWRYSGR